MIIGCRDCAELDERDETDIEITCDSCGGRMLTVQEAFDYILHLKRTLDIAGVDYEYEDA